MSGLAWVEDWGDAVYALAFVWSFFEGETFVILGGAGAQFGLIDLRGLIAAVWLGSFLGDQTWFWIGRRWGARALARFPVAERRSRAALEWMDRYGVGFILTFRFLYGIRNVASVVIGTSAMPWRRFLIWNFVAAGLWACTFAAIGFLFGEAAAAIGGEGPKALLMAAALTGALLVVWRCYLRARRRRRQSLGDSP